MSDGCSRVFSVSGKPPSCLALMFFTWSARVSSSFLSVVGLADYAFVGFCDVMLDADDVFETPWFAYVRCQFDGLVVDAI